MSSNDPNIIKSTKTNILNATSLSATAATVVGTVKQLSEIGRCANSQVIINSTVLTIDGVNVTPGAIKGYDIIFFDTLPTGTYSNGSAAAITTADQAKISGFTSHVNWIKTGTNSYVSQNTFANIPVMLVTNNLWILVVNRDSASTSAGTAQFDLTTTISFV